MLWVTVHYGPVKFTGLAKLRAFSSDSLDLFAPGWDMTLHLETAAFNVATPEEFLPPEDGIAFVCGFAIHFFQTEHFAILGELAQR